MKPVDPFPRLLHASFTSGWFSSEMPLRTPSGPTVTHGACSSGSWLNADAGGSPAHIGRPDALRGKGLPTTHRTGTRRYDRHTQLPLSALRSFFSFRC